MEKKKEELRELRKLTVAQTTLQIEFSRKEKAFKEDIEEKLKHIAMLNEKHQEQVRTCFFKDVRGKMRCER